MKKSLKTFIEELNKVLAENPDADVVSRNYEPGCGECGVREDETFEAPAVEIRDLIIIEEKGKEYGYDSLTYSFRQRLGKTTNKRSVVVIGR